MEKITVNNKINKNSGSNKININFNHKFFMKTVSLKKTVFLTIALAIISINLLNAQNIHSVFNANDHLVSSVVVSNPNTYINYMIGTTSMDADMNKDGIPKLFVAEMDYSFPTPQFNWIKYFPILTVAGTCGDIYLTGGLVHPTTDEFFVYGYCEKNLMGTFAVIKMTSGMPDNLAIRYLTNSSGSKITSACWANNPISSANTAYGIVYSGKFDRIFVEDGGLTNIQIQGGRHIPDYKMTSVAYDASLDNFVFGCVHTNIETKQAIGYLYNDPSTTTFESTQINYHVLIIPSIFGFQGQSRILIEGNMSFGQDVIIVNDIYYTEPPVGQGFLIIRINYLTGVRFYKAFTAPGYEIKLINLAENFANIYVLGQIEGNDAQGSLSKRRCILQTDFSFNFFMLKAMDDVEVASPTQEYLSDIVFNNPNFDVLSCGVFAGECYLVEIMDLFGDICDSQIPVINPPIAVEILSDSSFGADTHTLGGNNINITDDYYLIGMDICSFSPSNVLTEHIKKVQQSGGENFQKFETSKNENSINKKSQNTNTQINNIPVIQQYGNYFVCNNFTGTCNYKIFDVLGKIVQQGTTTNNTETTIPTLKAGIYNILVIDDNNNSESIKIFINE